MLSYALKHQYTQIVKPLLQYGANPNAPDQDGVLPLTEAARWRNHKNIAALLAAGADPNIVIPNAETPLHAAIRTTDVVPVADLLAAKADPNIVDGLSKKPALFAAIDVGSVNSVSVLLYAGADPRTKYNGQNALGYALTRQPQKDGVVAVLQHALRDPDFKNELPKHLPLITKSADVYFIKGAEPFERMD